MLFVASEQNIFMSNIKYFQPMIQYINKKDIYGPFMKRQDVYLPHSAEVTSDKYTNMRYQVTLMMMMIEARNKSSRRFYNHGEGAFS